MGPLLRKYDIGTSNRASELDVEIGDKLKQRRILLGLSQGGLAEQVGITFQQIQKYERGTNRISASKLYEFSIVLDVPVSYFFSSCENIEIEKTKNNNQYSDMIDQGKIYQPETLKLLNVYYSIKNKKLRKIFLNLFRVLQKIISD